MFSTDINIRAACDKTLRWNYNVGKADETCWVSWVHPHTQPEGAAVSVELLLLWGGSGECGDAAAAARCP